MRTARSRSRPLYRLEPRLMRNRFVSSPLLTFSTLLASTQLTAATARVAHAIEVRIDPAAGGDRRPRTLAEPRPSQAGPRPMEDRQRRSLGGRPPLCPQQKRQDVVGVVAGIHAAERQNASVRRRRKSTEGTLRNRSCLDVAIGSVSHVLISRIPFSSRPATTLSYSSPIRTYVAVHNSPASATQSREAPV